jgi:F0F1-type ATP synthase membrane subunit b/b'
MVEHKYEKQLLEQINLMEGGLLFGILKFFTKGKVKKALRKLARDPEMKAAIANLNHSAEELEKMIKDYEKQGKKYKRRLRW